MIKTHKYHVLISLFILAIYLALSAGTALTQIPGTDENYFANPAFNLLTKRKFATMMLETFGLQDQTKQPPKIAFSRL